MFYRAGRYAALVKLGMGPPGPTPTGPVQREFSAPRSIASAPVNQGRKPGESYGDRVTMKNMTPREKSQRLMYLFSN